MVKFAKPVAVMLLCCLYFVPAMAYAREAAPITAFPDAPADTYWQMSITDFDIYDAETQSRLWSYMMQPIVVADVEPTEHLYSVKEPGASSKEEANITGQIHGTTQGLHVIERRDGWALVEYYANDGYAAPFESVKDFSGLLVNGWVPENRLKTVEPNETIGLVIDKLEQKLYIFEQGQMTGELLVSTGLRTTKSPNTETPAGEFITDSWVGMFESYGMRCDMAIRINGGVLLHEVPHDVLADGTRKYTKYEPYLGQKASHGCIRIQRAKNEQGQNMTWLWSNLKRRAKVLIIDDAGRTLPPPDMSTPVYYNPDNGTNFHGDENCSGVKSRFLPLSPLTLADLYTEPYDKLTPCPYCAPPRKPEVIPEDVFGVGEEGEDDAATEAVAESTGVMDTITTETVETTGDIFIFTGDT